MNFTSIQKEFNSIEKMVRKLVNIRSGERLSSTMV